MKCIVHVHHMIWVSAALLAYNTLHKSKYRLSIFVLNKNLAFTLTWRDNVDMSHANWVVLWWLQICNSSTIQIVRLLVKRRVAIQNYMKCLSSLEQYMVLWQTDTIDILRQLCLHCVWAHNSCLWLAHLSCQV